MSEKYINKICEGYPSVNADYLRGLSDAPVYDDVSAEKAKDDEIARLKHENEVLRWAFSKSRTVSLSGTVPVRLSPSV